MICIAPRSGTESGRVKVGLQLRRKYKQISVTSWPRLISRLFIYTAKL